MDTATARWILGSASPRRRELLTALGIEPYVLAPDVDEDAILKALPAPLSEAQRDSQVCQLSSLKARRTAELLEQHTPSQEGRAVIVAADTMVYLDGHPLAKPIDRDDARSMLTRLAGRVHEVRTGLTLLTLPDGSSVSRSVATQVRFRPFDAARIEAYLDTGEHADKAGSYGIQGRGGALVEAFEGCYFNVVGLPVLDLCTMAEQLGLPLWTSWAAQG